MAPSDTEVHFEADREEFMSILFDITPGEIEKHHIDTIERKRAEAYAILLQKGGKQRIELHDGIIATATREEAQDGIDPHGNPFHEPEHYRFHVKFTSGQLEAFEKVLGLPCKNG